MLTLCTKVAALGLLALAGSVPAASTTTAPLTSSLPERVVERQMPQLECVLGFSKDYCGTMTPGHAAFSACITPIPEGTCRTLRLPGDFDVTMTNNTQQCGNAVTETCNESEHGAFKVRSNFLIRLHQNCPYRGCWEGDGTFVFRDGSTYQGRLTGTVGVGSHRPVTSPTICAVNGGRNCERCYDVSFSSTTGVWRLGFEAAFHGTRTDADTGEEVCFTLSGDFFIGGSATAGPDWSSVWRVGGTADGIQLTFCP